MADGEDGAGSTAGGPWARALSVLPPLVYMVLSALLSVTNRYIYHDRRPAFQMPALLITAQAVVVGLLTTAGLTAAGARSAAGRRTGRRGCSAGTPCASRPWRPASRWTSRSRRPLWCWRPWRWWRWSSA
ncbi:unnamed protein product [Prorocentrum cordatum]|uniref:Very-long-chain 3-oxoacyl-CoA synthase n=1 Tax=Prorocentrum cordatum TaxID=2364126 RepID=A0ABN9WYN2_9DINO|nr:unnamed protein product [Polarella glacialis]